LRVLLDFKPRFKVAIFLNVELGRFEFSLW